MNSSQAVAKREADERAREALGVSIREHAIRGCVWHCCLNCDNWGKITERSNQAGTPMKIELNICNEFNARPPDNIIVTGCERWHEVIPF